MYSFSFISSLAIFGLAIVHGGVLEERAILNGACTGADKAPGVCIPTSKCTSAGGNHITGACPNLLDDIKCCTKTSCGTGGNCGFTNECTGNTLSGLCPGPADFQCCVPKTSTGGYPTPAFPKVGACEKVAVDGAEKIVKGNPGKVRQGLLYEGLHLPRR